MKECINIKVKYVNNKLKIYYIIYILYNIRNKEINNLLWIYFLIYKYN